MPRLTFVVSILGLLSLGSVLAAPVPKPRDTLTERIEKRFGTVVNPDSLYEFDLRDDRLLLRVPERRNDTFGENCPRVYRNVKGDFIATVKIRMPSPAKLDEVPQITTGIFVSNGHGNTLHHSRVLGIQNGQIRRTGTLQQAENYQVRSSAGSGGGAFDPEENCMEISRKGDEIVARSSADGKGWHKLGSWKVGLGESAQVGLFVAHSSGPYTVEFREFVISPNP